MASILNIEIFSIKYHFKNCKGITCPLCPRQKKTIGKILEIFVGDESMKAHWSWTLICLFILIKTFYPRRPGVCHGVYHVHSSFLLSFLHLAEGWTCSMEKQVWVRYQASKKVWVCLRVRSGTGLHTKPSETLKTLTSLTKWFIDTNV